MILHYRYTPKSTHTKEQTWPGVPLLDCKQQLLVGTNVYVCENFESGSSKLDCYCCKVRDVNLPRGPRDEEDAFCVGFDYYTWPTEKHGKFTLNLNPPQGTKSSYWVWDAKKVVKGVLNAAEISETAGTSRTKKQYYRFSQLEHLLD